MVPQSWDEGDLVGHMSKRRRIDDHTGNAQAGASNLYEQWQHGYGTSQTGSPYGVPSTEQHVLNDNASAHTHGMASSHTGHWDPAASSDGYIAPYQDAGPLQQPYFYGQTDPAVYNSPWPPPLPHSVAQQAHAPYMAQSQPSMEAEESFISATPEYVATLQDFNINPYGYEHNRDQLQALHQQHSRPTQSPATYSEDASMHLKLQSLAILDNLVCPMYSRHL
jgi:hypothetical protein